MVQGSAPVSATVADSALRFEGQAIVLFAFDVGFQIDLDAAGSLVRQATRRRVVRARRPAPIWFDYSPAPLHLAIEADPVAVGGHATLGGVEILVYDFGAALLTFRVSLPSTLEGISALGAALHDNRELEGCARGHVERLVETIRGAIQRPKLNETVEDYVVFALTTWNEGVTPSDVVDRNRQTFARIIESERVDLSVEQANRSLEGRISYTPCDLAIIDWNAAVLFDREPEDVIAVIQHANVELLELRVLDQELDSILDVADETLRVMVRRRLWPSFAESRMLGRFASAQTDAAVMFEGVNNAIKLLGNQYLARFYRLAASRLDLPSWQASVQRKLEATESLYQKMADAASARRLETLEWVIIVLIAASIVLPFTPWYH